MKKDKKHIVLDEASKRLIEQIISDGDRAEIIPQKDGVKVVRVMRRKEQINIETRCFTNE